MRAFANTSISNAGFGDQPEFQGLSVVPCIRRAALSAAHELKLHPVTGHQLRLYRC